ncbi:Undecaprenyl-phosphate 4-deoxy-4-formamido-L-arabinose transferase [Posidoniimonas polymericola]|uniref:Undecaprenyl-phosphate 4-deoxy-4-formamido-L-arabinose transferase n=1 Tax=Posidoniimonas polymericola TaxID=2528002 RepID=A0A5C5YPU0_9BACT|nr:glycosyltransferase family 2 protein [Posidoniimonas polymericola]TWT76926.1 Undecaprenyl-phosphate 4-deoxy-4-formamido-L-arabinose transferase [Posidoniimonas polymericola]
MTSVSIVVPVYNEAESLRELLRQISEVAAARDYVVQVVFADDGSTDGSWEVIDELAEQDSRVLGVRLRRNFGKAAALSAGFEAAVHPFVVTMDGDLQDDPAEIPRLLKQIDRDQGGAYDVVSGWKQVRHDPLHKTAPSKVFNWLVSKSTGVKLNDHNCGLKAYRREVLNEVCLYGELHRFVPVLAAARGFKVTESVVNHRERKHGASKYGASRLVKGLLDILTVHFITGYAQRPQHMLGGFGLGSFLLGLLGLVYLACRWVLSRVIAGWEPIALHESPAMYYSLGFLMIGTQFLAIGLLGEMITARLSRSEDHYSIAEFTDPKKSEPQKSDANAPTPGNA